MRLAEICSVLATLFGTVLVLIGFTTIDTAYNYRYIGCTYMCDPSPMVLPEYFMLLGLIFLALGLGAHLYGKMHPADSICPWCGQIIPEEDGRQI